MADIYKLQGYTCENKNVYNEIKKANLTKAEFKKCDKNNDKIISEDEYAEFKEEFEDTEKENKDKKTVSYTNTDSSDDTKINSLKLQYQMQERLYYSKQAQIAQLNLLRAQAEFEVAAYPKDSDARRSAQGIVENLQGKIDQANSEASSYIKAMSDIKTDISKRKMEIEMKKAGISQSSSSGRTSGTSRTNGASGNYERLSSISTTKTKTISADLAQRLDTKLGSGFAAKCEQIAEKLNCNPNDLLCIMYNESGINPKLNSGACGLICFMPSVVESMGLTQSQVVNMSGVEQLDLVYTCFKSSKAIAGISDSTKLDAGTLYALCFLPAYANREILCSANDPETAIYYNANYGGDEDGDGNISKTDLAVRMQKKFVEMNQYF